MSETVSSGTCPGCAGAIEHRGGKAGEWCWLHTETGRVYCPGEPQTLGEYLDWLDDQSEVRSVRVLRRILYGTDKPCPVCLLGTNGPSGLVQVADHELSPCLRCAGSGRLKTPGVSDRLKRAFLCGDGTYDGFAVERLLEAIRREIGEAP